jgi:hypothetical protein
MRTRKFLKYPLILAVILLTALRGNLCALTSSQISASRNEVLKSETLLDAKGIIESTPELCNGGSFQNSINKLKNLSGNKISFSTKQKITTAFIVYLLISSFETSKTPIYLFNRSILI